jgi:type II secretory pathway pseudopilin PulG
MKTLLAIIGGIALLVGAGWFVYSGAQQQRRSRNEAAAEAEFKTIDAMIVQYQSQYGRYPTTLAELGPPTSGEPGPHAADLIPAAIASGETDGYRFSVTAFGSGYSITAVPIEPGTTGEREFHMDQRGK